MRASVVRSCDYTSIIFSCVFGVAWEKKPPSVVNSWCHFWTVMLISSALWLALSRGFVANDLLSLLTDLLLVGIFRLGSLRGIIFCVSDNGSGCKNKCDDSWMDDQHRWCQLYSCFTTGDGMKVGKRVICPHDDPWMSFNVMYSDIMVNYHTLRFQLQIWKD